MKRRACIVVSSEMTVRAFLLRQLAAMQQDYDVTVVVNTGNSRLLEELGVPQASLRRLRIARQIAPARDLWCLAALVRLMWRERFDLVQSVTPKAGLLAMVAAWLTGVRARVHTFTGQVWATREGLSRRVLKMSDWLVARTATHVLADSASQREFLIAEGVVPASKIAVLGAGSVSGVDTARFRPSPGVRQAVRRSLGIRNDDVLLLFIGRIHREKGVLDLARAFLALADQRPDVHLIVAGPDEQGLAELMRRTCARHAARLHFSEFTSTPERLMAAADILCLPSYREGFGSVIIEAAAVGVPAVASRIYGIVDAVVDGQTGLLHEAANVNDLISRLEHLISDAAFRRSLGESARARAEREFSQGAITAAVLERYRDLLHDSRPRQPRSRRREPASFYGRHGKRLVDVLAATFLAILLLPVTVTLACLVRVFLGSPVLFRQTRPGLHGAPFVLVKFRSMADRRDAGGTQLPDDQRLTAFGRFLRATSLDEIPELWNVLAGDMSLVGPRPLLMEYLPLYSPSQARRHAVRPGITGLAQVNGRNGLAWDRRFQLDVEYVERCSLALDIVILARTIVAVVLRRGITQPERATVDYFRGNVASHG